MSPRFLEENNYFTNYFTANKLSFCNNNNNRDHHIFITRLPLPKWVCVLGAEDLLVPVTHTGAPVLGPLPGRGARGHAPAPKHPLRPLRHLQQGVPAAGAVGHHPDGGPHRRPIPAVHSPCGAH